MTARQQILRLIYSICATLAGASVALAFNGLVQSAVYLIAIAILIVAVNGYISSR